MAVLLCGAAVTTRMIDREGTMLVRWRVSVFGGASIVLSVLPFALEGLRFPGATP